MQDQKRFPEKKILRISRERERERERERGTFPFIQEKSGDLNGPLGRY